MIKFLKNLINLKGLVLLLLLVLAACGASVTPGPGGGGGPSTLGVAGGSAANPDVIPGKGDIETLPAGKLSATAACLTAIATGGTTSVSIPSDNTLKLNFQGAFEVMGGGSSPFEVRCDTSAFSTKGIPIRVVWYSDTWTEPKYRDILVDDLRDGINFIVDDLHPRVKDRLAFYFYEEAYFSVESLDGKADGKTITKTYFYGPPPSKEWKVISNDEMVYFTNLKDGDGKPMVHFLGSVQFLIEAP